MVFLHVHERRVVICLAIAVSISADMQIPCVLLQLAEPFRDLLQRFLKDGLMMALLKSILSTTAFSNLTGESFGIKISVSIGSFS